MSFACQGFVSYCAQQFITTKNGQPQTTTPGNQGAKGDANEVLEIVNVPFNSAGLFTDGFDLETQYDFALSGWDVPGGFVVRSLINRTSKFIADPNQPGLFAREMAGVLGGGFNSTCRRRRTRLRRNRWMRSLQSVRGFR